MSTTKRRIALVLAFALMCSMVAVGLSVKANAADQYVSVDALADNGVAAPEKDTVVPDANQYQYQKKGLSAFCHFGPNTFNEIEWGESYGTKTPDEIFKLEDNLDAEQLVKALKEAGFGTLIVTAKHHDGFCIWNSAYTTYNSSQSSYGEYDYDGMGGDVLAELSAACTKYDLDMGLYLSPWDIHDPAYGYYTANGTGGNATSDAIDYNDYYNAQLEEILSNPIYGNDGHFVEVWMDGAKGSGANAQDYDFQRWFATIQKYEGVAAGYPADAMLFGAQAYTGVRWIGNESGLSNEQTWSKSVTNKSSNTIDSNNIGSYTAGWSNGNQWTVPEADSKITSGWFWGNSKKTPATMADLANRYFSSVGYNSVMLLNVPPNNQGSVDQLILDRVAEFGEAVTGTFANNKAADAVISASQVRGNDTAYSPANLLDGDPLTYWTVEDNTTSGSVLIDLGKTTTFDVVSIEESIEFGQRITSFRVEYSNDATNWSTMKEGSTIGAKRLVRTAPVKARYVKITVSTNDSGVYTYSGSNTAAKGTVPMLAEIGIYKATEGFALGTGAPDGMEVIDERDSRFSFTGTWNNESGSQFPIEQTGKWCNAGASFTVNFTGSKIYLVGTIDPNHGTADILIDGVKVDSINTYAASRSLGQILYTSPDLAHGEHTLTLTATSKAIGIDGAYVINNGGVGMIGIENAKYTMDENETMEVKLVRVGGSTGEATVLVSPNPGSAVQGDYNTELIPEVTFADGVTEMTAQVQTKRNTNTTGEQYFTIELSTETEGLILGFNTVARINIRDTESFTKDLLRTLVNECTALNSNQYTADTWAALTEALTAANTVLDNASATADGIKAAYEALLAAKDGLKSTVRTQYTADDRFIFPTSGTTATLEMDLLELHNNTSDDGGWPLQITQKDWASGGKFLNCLNSLDEVYLYYTAEAGTYTCTVYYRSGDSRNSLEWYDDEGKVQSGEVTAGASDGAGATHQVTFTITVLEGGDGMLKFSGGTNKGPQLDYIEITKAG